MMVYSLQMPKIHLRVIQEVLSDRVMFEIVESGFNHGVLSDLIDRTIRDGHQDRGVGGDYKLRGVSLEMLDNEIDQ